MKRHFTCFDTSQADEYEDRNALLFAAVTIEEGDAVPDTYNLTTRFGEGTIAIKRTELIDFCERVLAMDRDVRFSHYFVTEPATSAAPVSDPVDTSEIPF